MHLIGRDPEKEAKAMCPEPDFCLQYRELISWYRLTPEASERQLDAILRRLQTRAERTPVPALPPQGKEVIRSE